MFDHASPALKAGQWQGTLQVAKQLPLGSSFECPGFCIVLRIEGAMALDQGLADVGLEGQATS